MSRLVVVLFAILSTIVCTTLSNEIVETDDVVVWLDSEHTIKTHLDGLRPFISGLPFSSGGLMRDGRVVIAMTTEGAFTFIKTCEISVLKAEDIVNNMQMLRICTVDKTNQSHELIFNGPPDAIRIVFDGIANAMSKHCV